MITAPNKALHRMAMSILVPISCAAGFPAQAQEAQDIPLQALRSCQAITSGAERLTCFDRAAADLLQATEAGELRVVDREEIRETRRGLFGFSLPKLGLFANEEKDGLDQSLTSTITEVRRVGREGYLVTIAEGSRWRVNDAPARFRPEAGDAIELEKAALGSFWLRVNGATGVKGSRVE